MPLGAFKAALMGTAGVSTGDVVLLHDTDYSNVASASITSGINSTYGEYIFKFYNINPATDEVDFTVNFSTDGGSNYNMTKTTTTFWSEHDEGDSFTSLEYRAGSDLAQGTGYQPVAASVGNGGDESCAGELHLFNPSNTTYVKHFYSVVQEMHDNPASVQFFAAGYVNSTSDIDAVQFKMSSGNFDGTIKMWGVK
jgi:hypothetical protein